MSIKAYHDAFLAEKYRVSHFTQSQDLGIKPDLTFTKLLNLKPSSNYLTELSYDPVLNRQYITIKNGERKYSENELTDTVINERSNIRPLIVSVIPEKFSTMTFTPSTELMIATAIFIVYKGKVYTAMNFGATRDINLLLGIYHEFYSISPRKRPTNLGEDICNINIPDTKLDLVFKRNGYDEILRKSMHNV